KLPFPKLTTLLVTSNLLTAITPSTFENMEVVDISNNNIGHLPPELGRITTIKTLLVEGNSFRVPRYTIVQAGTTAIMEYLRGKIPTS
ncbi:17193_t:CDS:1, partial [Acaulospora morrowiae]